MGATVVDYKMTTIAMNGTAAAEPEKDDYIVIIQNNKHALDIVRASTTTSIIYSNLISDNDHHMSAHKTQHTTWFNDCPVWTHIRAVPAPPPPPHPNPPPPCVAVRSLVEKRDHWNLIPKWCPVWSNYTCTMHFMRWPPPHNELSPCWANIYCY